MKINKLLESKKLKESWTQFKFKSGGNPYIAKTEDEVNRMLTKYKGKVKQNGDGSYIVDDTEKDLFSVDESLRESLSNEDIVIALEKTPYTSFVVDEEEYIKIQGKWRTTSRRAHSDYIEIKAFLDKKLGSGNFNLVYETNTARDGGKEISCSLRLELKNYLKEESKSWDEHQEIMQRKTSGYDKCYKIVKKARTSNPIDTKALNDARDHFGYDLYKMCLDDVLKEMSNLDEAFKPSDSGIQSVKCYNRYNYTIQELRVDNDNKTFERGQFTVGRPDKKTKNRQEFEDIVDTLEELGYAEIKSDYRSMRNKTRNGVPTNESKQSGEDKDFIKRIKAEIEKIIPYPEDFKVFYDGSPDSNRDYVLKMTRSDKSQTTSKIKGAIRAAGGTSAIGGIKKALAREYFDIAFDKKDTKTNESLSEGYQPADEWWLKVNPDDIEGANELKGLYADDMIRNKNSLEQYGLSDRLTKELNKVFAKYGSPIESAKDQKWQYYVGDRAVPYTSYEDAFAHLKDDFNILEYKEELKNYLRKEGVRYDIDETTDDKLCIDINWGDWKHDHLFVDQLVQRFFTSKGLSVSIEKDVSMSDGSDCYSALHIYELDDLVLSGKAVEESIENVNDEDEIKESYKIDDLKAYYNSSTSLQDQYPNFFAWYDYMKKSGKITNEDIAVSSRYEFDDDVDELTYYYDDEVFKSNLESNPYAEIKSKQVMDSDGFMTDYTMYMNINTGEYVFVFGDKDAYTPDNGYFNWDWECETEEEANEWFDNYNGFDDSNDDLEWFNESLEEEDIIHKKSDGSYLVKSSSGDGYTAFNRSDVCIGHISGDNDEDATNKFNTNRFE